MNGQTIAERGMERVRGPTHVTGSGILAVLAFGVMAAEPDRLSAQGAGASPTLIPDAPTCETCRITRHRIATIRDDEYAPGALITAGMVHVNSDSTFLVIAGSFPSSDIFATDRDGRITRRIGGQGEGPGEYRMPRDIGETETSYVFFDPMLGRMTALSKDTFAPVSTVLAPYRPGPPVVFFADGSMVFHGNVRTRAAAGFAFHVVAPDGSITSSFGPLPAADSAGFIAASGDSAIWVSYRGGYRLEHWSLNGRRLASLDREATWFKARSPEADAPGDRFHRVRGLHQDAEGRLWVYVSEFTSTGYPAFDPDPSAGATIIEVLDPTAMNVIARTRWEVNPGEYCTVDTGFFQQRTHATEEGLLTVEIWANRLTGRNSP